jgi:hypothetical protein
MNEHHRASKKNRVREGAISISDRKVELEAKIIVELIFPAI